MAGAVNQQVAAAEKIQDTFRELQRVEQILEQKSASSLERQPATQQPKRVMEPPADPAERARPRVTLAGRSRVAGAKLGEQQVVLEEVRPAAIGQREPLDFDGASHPSSEQYQRVLTALLNPGAEASEFDATQQDVVDVIASLTDEAARERALAMLSGQAVTTPDLHFLGRGGDSEDGGIHHVHDHEMWEEVCAIMDSGAADSVAPPAIARCVPIKESKGSLAGQKYFTADGSRLPNQGEKTVLAYTAEGKPVKMVYQIAEVTKPLNSVGRICDKENVVAFGKSGGYILNLWTHEKTPFVTKGSMSSRRGSRRRSQRRCLLVGRAER